MSQQEDMAQARRALTQITHRVPEGVAHGSYQISVAFKSWVRNAQKALRNERTPLASINALINQYEIFK